MKIFAEICVLKPEDTIKVVEALIEDNCSVVIRALLEHAVAIAHGQWEPAEVRRVINEIVDDVLVAGELMSIYAARKNNRYPK